MRVGLYCDLRKTDESKSWPAVYAATLERIVEAEAGGMEAVWTTEHHGFADGYLPQPLVFSAAIAARTTKIRIGTAIVIGPLKSAMQLAEEAAVVDILSDGRLELGLGAGWRTEEFEAFGADHAKRYKRLEERARQLEQLWDAGAATPPPVQRPLPTWLGVRGPRGARIAGRVGAGLLWIDRELMPPYREGLEQGGHDPASAKVGGLVNIFLADDPERAREQILAGARHRRSTYKGAEVKGKASAGPRLEVLDPAAGAARIHELTEGLPVTDVFCFERVGDDEELANRHVELLAGELPALLNDER
jgi:alkanesulfonate monooxygenase SsuD/methylene tetrahydromethanopterin reductase-like flavin-dependent oxidoreductase (luciferase family)